MAMFFTEHSNAAGSVMVFLDCIFAQGAGAPGMIRAVIHAERIWMIHRHHGTAVFVKSTEVMPKINAGPALLQKGSIRSPSSRDKLPFFHALWMHCAPTG
jgi:hypothetical protein